MTTSTNNDYAPGFFETVAAAVVATDDNKLGHLLAVALREAGIAVKETHSFDGLSAEASRSQLFVVDGDSRCGNAVEALRQVRGAKSGEDCAIVFLSHGDSLEAYDAGVDMVLCKPISIPLFMARISSVMRRYRVII